MPLPSHLVIELRIKTINELQCLSRLPKKLKPLQKQLAASRVKEDHPTLCDDAAAVFAKQMCHAHLVLHRLAQRPPSVLASTITPDEIAYDDSKNSDKKRVAAPVCLMHTLVFPPASSTHLLSLLVSPLAERPMTLEKRKQVVAPL